MAIETTVEENKKAVRRGIAEVWNANNWAASGQCYADDVVVHFPVMPEPIRGRAAFGELHAIVHKGFPDYDVTIDELLGEGDRAAARWTLRATHTGEFLGIPPTGSRIVVEEYAFFRFADGKAQEIWLMPNLMGQLTQLGVMPEGPPPRAMILAMLGIKKIRGLFRRRKP